MVADEGAGGGTSMEKFKKILKGTAIVIGAFRAAFLFFAGATQIYKFILGMNVQLVGTEWVSDDGGIVPGETMEVHPVAENNSKRSGAYVFISITLSCSDSVPVGEGNADDGGGNADDGIYTDMYDFKVNDAWTQVAEERENGVVTYTYAYGTADGLTVLPAGETTPPLTDGIRFTPYERLENLTDEDARIKYAILSVASVTFNADGKTAEEAWKAVRGLR